MIDEEALAERADELVARMLNGIDQVQVELAGDTAIVDVLFHNELHVAELATDPSIFSISGGRRRQVQVTSVTAGGDARMLRLVVAPIGDYSTYRLRVLHAAIDPVFAEIPFRFRPGCFTVDCKPSPRRAAPMGGDPGIDYTAKDYASFRHLIHAAMARRLPGWEPSSEPDLTQLLIGYLAAAADELSDYQDRVAGERAIDTARSRVSLARHARLVDYHVHQGNQASTVLALEVGAGVDTITPATLIASTASGEPFAAGAARRALGALDAARLYTWSGTRPGLDIGATSADLAISGAAATAVVGAIATGDIDRLVIWEAIDPDTGRDVGRDTGRDVRKRQLVHLLPSAVAAIDPVTGDGYVRLQWRADDALLAPYCATIDTPPRDGATLVSGNLVDVSHGRVATATFGDGERAWEATRWGTVCRLPGPPVLYRDTPPGGEVPPSSTIAISIVVGATHDDTWQERVSLVHAKPDEACFAVETDELGRTAIRFGTGDHGRALPEDAHVIVTWQGGDPLAGNVGAGAIAVCAEPTIIRCWNPFDVTNARAPEPRDQIVRRAPELYRTRQLRGVTLADIVARAEEVPGVARAAARYVWTGSWTAVRLAIDPEGTDVLDDELRRRVAEYLAPIILIGDDLELRAARYVPVEVIATVCIAPEAWPEHVRGELLDELSDGFTADGRRGLFHPDTWTFGQSLHASQIIGRIQAVAGVAHVTRVELRRYREPTPGAGDAIEVAAHEIIQVRNDPDDMERGSIELQLVGGRA